MNNIALFKRDEIAKLFLDGLKAGLGVAEAAAQITDPDEFEVLRETYKKGYFLGYRWYPTGVDVFLDRAYADADKMIEYVEEVRKIYPQLTPNEDIQVFMKNAVEFDTKLPAAELYNVRVYLPKRGMELPESEVTTDMVKKGG